MILHDFDTWSRYGWIFYVKGVFSRKYWYDISYHNEQKPFKWTAVALEMYAKLSVTYIWYILY